MSVHAMSWVLRHSEEKLGNRLVLLVLADYAADDGTSAFPKVTTIASDARLSRSQVQRCLRSLEENGSIEQTGKRSSGTREYRVVMEGPQYAAPGAASTTPEADQGPHPDTEGAAGRGPTHHEPSVRDEPSEELAAVAAYDPLKGTKIEGQNVPWDALVKATQADERTEGGKIGQALKIIRRVVVEDSSPQTFDDPANGEWWIARQISARAHLYRRRWPNVELTPTALASNWSRVVTAQPGQDPEGVRAAAQRGLDYERETA